MIKKRTYVYVDGFNVYYGIRYTPYRWLDLGRLARLTVPNAEISAIRYFTARIEARDDPDQPQRQAIYLRALQTIPDLSIHFGQFRSNPVRMALVNPPPIGTRTAVADITYVSTAEGFLYLACVLDVCTRRVVGWAMRTTLAAEIVTAALDMAIARAHPAAGLIHHSDHGSQYTSFVFGRRCQEAGIVPSMGSVGDAYDNAMAESFLATLECELLDRERFETREQARTAIFDYLETFDNPRRRHSALDYASPMQYEGRWQETTSAPSV